MSKSIKNFNISLLYLSIVIVFSGIVGFLTYYFYSKPLIEESIPVSELKNEARLVLDYNNGSRRYFEGKVVKGMTVFDALKQSSEAGNFDIEYYFNAEAIIVNAINGIGSDGKKWTFYKNGNSINFLTQEITSGDEIEVRYE